MEGSNENINKSGVVPDELEFVRMKTLNFWTYKTCSDKLGFVRRK